MSMSTKSNTLHGSDRREAIGHDYDPMSIAHEHGFRDNLVDQVVGD